MGSILGRIRGLSSNINYILPTDRWLNREIKLNTRTVSKALCQLHTKQLGIVITSYIVYIQCNTIKRNGNITI